MKSIGATKFSKLRRLILPSFSVCLLFTLAGCNDDEANYCPDVEPAITVGAINFMQQATAKNNLLSCHNCYNDNSALLEDTLATIEYNLALPIDIIELDVELFSDNAIITHQPDGTGVPLHMVLENSLLVGANKVLFLELKNKLSTVEQADYLLNAINEYLGRIRIDRGDISPKPIVVRTAVDIDSTLIFNERLSSATYSHLEEFVKTSHILYPKSTKATLDEVQQAYQCGSEMVEFSVRKGSQALDVKLSFASSLGLATNVYTLNESNYQEVIINGGKQSDVLTIKKEEVSAISSERSTSLYEQVLALVTRQ